MLIRHTTRHRQCTHVSPCLSAPSPLGLQVEDRQAAAGSMGYLDFMQQLQKMLMSKAG